MERIITNLRKLGLNVYESKAYLGLTTTGVATAAELAETSGIPRAKVYEVLKGLEKSGFVISAGGRPAKFKAMPMDAVISKIQDQARSDHDERLRQIDRAKTAVMKELAGLDTPLDEEAEGMVWVLKGRENIYTSIEKLIDEAKKKLTFATTEKGVLRKLSHYGAKLAEAAERGVEVKLLAPVTAINARVIKDNLERFDIKHSYTAMTRFLLSDDEKGIVILVPDGVQKAGESALYVNSPYFISGLGHYFDHKWEKTLPGADRLKELGM